jgi:hypothetical protein
MQTYFFHLRDGADILLDPDGRKLPSLAAVMASALREARAIISADAQSGTIKLNQQLDIEDEAGEIVHSLHLKDAVTIKV